MTIGLGPNGGYPRRFRLCVPRAHGKPIPKKSLRTLVDIAGCLSRYLPTMISISWKTNVNRCNISNNRVDIVSRRSRERRCRYKLPNVVNKGDIDTTKMTTPKITHFYFL